MIEIERYHAIRSRAITLHAIITKRTFPFWVFPSHTMTTDQIRDRVSYMSSDTVPDSDAYARPVKRGLTIEKAIKLLENVTDDQPLKVDQPNKNVIQIVDTIQEYNSLWYELYLTNSNYGSINPEEIRYLEQLAFYMFDDYARIKLYLDQRAHREDERQSGKAGNGLLGLVGLFQLDHKTGRHQRPEFISYYDLLTTRVLPNIGHIPQDAYNVPARNNVDSLLRQEEARKEFGIWGS